MPENTSSTPESAGLVFIVDDVPANVRLLAGILKVADYDVVTATSGIELLEKVEEVAPDVVLLDVMMPEMDGFEVCRRLRAQESTSTLPIVMVTALHESEDRVRALEVGADDFLTKPVNEVEVVARVKSLVRIKRGRDALERAYTDLQRAEDLRDSLSSMLVHDLRTPLTTIIAPMQMLQNQDLGELNETQIEVAAMAIRSAQRLLHLINELLDVSKMEDGRLTLTKTDIDIPRAVEEAIEFTGAERKGLSDEATREIVREYSNELPTLNCDVDLVRRVLANLLGNAMKFTPKDKVIALGARLENEEMLFWVRDEGDGVPAEFHEKIFDKFGQVESRQEGRKFSTGLGLTFCKLAVEAHGGRIWLESVEHEGSTFFFSLPLKQAEAAALTEFE